MSPTFQLDKQNCTNNLRSHLDKGKPISPYKQRYCYNLMKNLQFLYNWCRPVQPRPTSSVFYSLQGVPHGSSPSRQSRVHKCGDQYSFNIWLWKVFPPAFPTKVDDSALMYNVNETFLKLNINETCKSGNYDHNASSKRDGLLVWLGRVKYPWCSPLQTGARLARSRTFMSNKIRSDYRIWIDKSHFWTWVRVLILIHHHQGTPTTWDLRSMSSPRGVGLVAVQIGRASCRERVYVLV